MVNVVRTVCACLCVCMSVFVFMFVCSPRGSQAVMKTAWPTLEGRSLRGQNHSTYVNVQHVNHGEIQITYGCCCYGSKAAIQTVYIHIY